MNATFSSRTSCRMPMALTSFARQPDDTASRAAELALQRLHLHDRGVEVLLKKIFENVHEV